MLSDDLIIGVFAPTTSEPYTLARVVPDEPVPDRGSQHGRRQPVASRFAVRGVFVGLVAGDLLAAGAGNMLDQVIVVVVDAQGGFVDFDGDDLPGLAQPDLDALADDVGAPGAGHGALGPGGTLVEDRSRAGVWAPWRRARWVGVRISGMVWVRTRFGSPASRVDLVPDPPAHFPSSSGPWKRSPIGED
ncbi:MAG: hypothetical protein QOJ06_980 [Pseudonocardiales bacterium]|nr:hypothetical protein [Pseudonocardiales bacterium]